MEYFEVVHCKLLFFVNSANLVVVMGNWCIYSANKQTNFFNYEQTQWFHTEAFSTQLQETVKGFCNLNEDFHFSLTHIEKQYADVKIPKMSDLFL